MRRLSRPHSAKHLYFGGLTLCAHLKSMESSRNIKSCIKCSLLCRVKIWNIINNRNLESIFWKVTNKYVLLFKFTIYKLYYSIDLIWVPKVNPPKYRYLAKFGPESLPNCHKCLVWHISISKMDVSMYLSKNGWNRYFVWPTIYGNPLVIEPCLKRTSFVILSLALICYTQVPRWDTTD